MLDLRDYHNILLDLHTIRSAVERTPRAQLDLDEMKDRVSSALKSIPTWSWRAQTTETMSELYRYIQRMIKYIKIEIEILKEAQ